VQRPHRLVGRIQPHRQAQRGQHPPRLAERQRAAGRLDDGLSVLPGDRLDHRLGFELPGDVLRDRPPPQPQRGLEQVQPLPRVTSRPRPRRQLPELKQVQRLPVYRDPVPPGGRPQPPPLRPRRKPGFHHPPYRPDVLVHHVHRVPRRLPPPHRLHDPRQQHRVPRPRQQQRQHRTLTRSTQLKHHRLPYSHDRT
jgi:hypothetical protein